MHDEGQLTGLDFDAFVALSFNYSPIVRIIGELTDK
jgi:hypothetical protein